MNDGSAALRSAMTWKRSVLGVVPGARRACLALAPFAFKAFTWSSSALIRAAWDAMVLSSRLFACALCRSSLSFNFSTLRLRMARWRSTARRFSSFRVLMREAWRTLGAFTAPRLPCSSACFQWYTARSMRLWPMRDAGRPADAKMAPGRSPAR